MVQKFGEFQGFCAKSTLPACNLFPVDKVCTLTGIKLSNDRHLRNLGSILFDGLAILVTCYLLWRSQRKRAAVGRREMQVFLVGYLIICICEIFTVGGIPGLGQGSNPIVNESRHNVVYGFTAVHIATITATFWILLLNAAVGYQFLDDGTPVSLGLVAGSALAFFIGSGYIVLDTALGWTNKFKPSVSDAPHINYGIYVFYLLFPLICLALFFLLETYLVVKDLGEIRPMYYLAGSFVAFAIGMVFDFAVSEQICHGTNGKIDGTMFQTFFVLVSVVLLWWFWNNITEDDWPVTIGGDTPVLA